ncbi:hypothetical protein HG530_011138 [Fusarium avenaceum]|nr:hypothetical protein HG530_011138 [Fusarium avenaceum]
MMATVTSNAHGGVNLHGAIGDTWIHDNVDGLPFFDFPDLFLIWLLDLLPGRALALSLHAACANTNVAAVLRAILAIVRRGQIALWVKSRTFESGLPSPRCFHGTRAYQRDMQFKRIR